MTQRCTARWPVGAARVALWCAVLGLCGCLDQWPFGRRDPESGAALFVDNGARDVTPAELSALAAAGVGTVFVQAAELGGSRSGLELARRALPSVPRRTRVVLAIDGAWPGPGEPADEAPALLRQLLQLKLDAETRGLAVDGYHFDVAAEPAELEGYGALLRAMRRGLDRQLLLSARLEEGWLDAEQLSAVTEAIDFGVCRVYGQSLDEPEVTRSWDLDSALGLVEQLEHTRLPYLVGIHLCGSARFAGETATAPLAALPLRALVSSGAVEVKPVFSFEGFHRQVFELPVLRSGSLGELRLRRGQTLRVSRPTAYHLHRLRRELLERELPHWLGELYIGWPPAGASLCLSPEDLLRSRGSAPLTPALEAGAEVVDQSGTTWHLRFRLTNPDSLPTGVAAVDHNYLEVRLDGGAFGRVELGEFQRMELGRSDRERFDMGTIRNADILRLYYPLLEPGWTAVSGPVELRLRRPDPTVSLGASFLLPDGESVQLDPAPWDPEAAAREVARE